MRTQQGSVLIVVSLILGVIIILAGGLYLVFIPIQQSNPSLLQHFVGTKSVNNQDSEQLSTTPTPRYPESPEISYFNKLRLKLFVPTQDRKDCCYLNSNTGELLDSSQVDPTKNPTGRIVNYQKDINPFEDGTLIGDRFYVGFADEKSFFVGYISSQVAKAVPLPETVYHSQNWPPKSLVLNKLHPSPNAALMATTLGGDGVCESTASGSGCRGHVAILVFTPELTNFQAPYWEDLQSRPPPLKRDKFSFAEVGADLGILSWDGEGKNLYVTWSLGDLGPPPTAGLARIDLAGNFTDTGLSTDLAPLAVSPDNKYALAARDFFGFSDPALFELSTKKLISLPYSDLVAALRKKYGSDPQDRPGRADGLSDFSFSSDSKFVSYSIWLNVGPAGTNSTETVGYKVNVANPSLAIEAR